MADSILGRYQVAPEKKAEERPPEPQRSGPIMDRYVISQATESPPPPAAEEPGRRVAETRFQRSAEPPPPVAPEAPELTWAETGQQAAKSFLPSALEAGRALVGAVTSPIDTAKAFGQLGAGVASKVAGAIGIEQDPQEKAQTESLANALGEHYSNIYGGLLRGETGAFKKAFAEDPFSIVMDASTALGGAGLAAKGAGLSKTAAALGKVSAATDPVSLAVRAAKAPISAVRKALPYVQSIPSGSSVNALKTAQQAGRTSNPVLKRAFEAHLKGADPMEIVEKSQSALSKLAAERGAQYVSDIAKAKAGGLPQLPWTSVDNALKNNLAKISFQVKGPAGAAGPMAAGSPQFTMYRQAKESVDEIQKAIDFFKNQPMGSNAHTLEGFDALKRFIGEVQDASRQNPVAYGVATDMYNSVLNTIKTSHPQYAKAMEAYQAASKELADMRSAFGLGRRGVADESVLRRILSTKDGTTKKTLLDDLAKVEPEIPYMLAGQELKDILPGGLKAYIANAGLAPIAFGVNPLLVVGQAALSSPRLAGRTQQAIGAASRAGAAATSRPVTTSAYYAGRVGEEAARPEGATTVGSVGMPVAQEDASVDKVFDRMLQIESNKRQFDRQGNVMTSSAGALGIAQIMPTTAPEAARLAGLPYSPERLRNDPEYNQALGRAYFEEQLRTFGDPVLAAAAYNAGPAAVRRALRDARESGESFANFLPRETQDYIQKIFGQRTMQAGGRIARATGGKIGSPVHSLVNKLMQAAEGAKNHNSSSTQDFLDVHDDNIAKALAVADKAI